MKHLITRQEGLSDDESAVERWDNGVKIVEHETHYVIKLIDGRYVGEPSPRESRLVVIDDVSSNTTELITRDRSSIAGLDAFIRSITNSHALTK
jgi:hypothetical protein